MTVSCCFPPCNANIFYTLKYLKSFSTYTYFLENTCPASPTKHQKASIDSPNHNLPKNNQPVILPPKKKHIGNISLDKILDDLDVENSEDYNKYKVKSLIKHFSRSDSECDVELRTNRQSNISREDVDSNELSRLLDELAKVTCAPILTPGVTSSLISSNLTDEEVRTI